MRKDMAIIGTIQGCEIVEEGDGRVYFEAKAGIDADGANGQHGKPVAYNDRGTGAEALSSGGMAFRDGRVVCAHPWARDVVILGPDDEPRVFPGGMIASKTWYKYPGKKDDDPAAYVDAQYVPYIVVPPLIVDEVRGVVRGCRARATWKGRSIDCVVADRGPASKLGEMSVAAAKALGIPASPRTGGADHPKILYELWPGIAAPGFELQPA
jgi:hypothetical protein